MGSFPVEILTGDSQHVETVSAGIPDSCEHVEEKGTVCVMSADTAAAESIHCNATSTGEVWTRDTLQLEIFTLDAIHAGTVAVVLGDTLNLVLSSVEVLAADQLIEETLAEDILAAETLSVELVTADTLADGRQTVAAAASAAADLVESKRSIREATLHEALAELQKEKVAIIRQDVHLRLVSMDHFMVTVKACHNLQTPVSTQVGLLGDSGHQIQNSLDCSWKRPQSIETLSCSRYLVRMQIAALHSSTFSD